MQILYDLISMCDQKKKKSKLVETESKMGWGNWGDVGQKVQKLEDEFTAVWL